MTTAVSAPPLRVLFLTEGVEIPASRFRVVQFLPHFERAGVQCTVQAGYGKAYNQLQQGRWGNVYKLACRLKRVAATVAARRFDVVFLQRSALPMTSLPELALACRGARLVFDFDDAVYLAPGGRASVAYAATFRSLVRISSAVIAGSPLLASRVADPVKTHVLPTVVDTEAYCPQLRRHDPRVIVGWMGTSGNFASLRMILPDVFSVLARHPQVRFRVVSNATLPELDGHPRVEQIPWRADEEIELLRSFDLGLMPLVDDEVSLGKCGFKMLQYHAVGMPVIASDVGVNKELFCPEGGALVAPGGSWVNPLEALIRAPELRAAQGVAGRKHVVARFSVEAVLPRYLQLFASSRQAEERRRQ